MRFTARAAALAAAVAFAQRSADARAKIKMQAALLLRADRDGVEITGHALDHCHATTCVATVYETGAVAVSADRVTALLGAIPGNSDITIASIDAMIITAGRSRYRLSTIPADNFPQPLTPKAGASVILTPADATALLAAPSAAVSTESTTRLHLCGVYVHTIDGMLSAAATDGVKLMRRISAIEAKLPCGIIIPASAVTEIARLARDNSVTLATDGRIIEARTTTTRFASKLISGPFPDYARLLSPPAATAADFDSAEMRGALARLAAVSGRNDKAAVGLTWEGGGALSLVLANEDDAASDTLAAATSGTARVACSAGLLSGLIEAIGAKRVRLSIEDRPGAALRLDAPDDIGVVAIVAPRSGGPPPPNRQRRDDRPGRASRAGSPRRLLRCAGGGCTDGPHRMSAASAWGRLCPAPLERQEARARRVDREGRHQ
jgi:DNA polymerase III subunit beta